MAVDMSFLIADSDYYEPPEAVDPGARYHPHPVPADWHRSDSGVWTQWTPAGFVMPAQGWKVHVSSTLANAPWVLDVVATACVALGVAFKHLAGDQTFLLVHDKQSARVQSGKFCTVYPTSEHCALRLMQRLERELAGVGGTYVLTDRRFGGSSCVSYRYGGFHRRNRIDPDGYPVPTLLDPAGTEIDDERRAVFWLPAGLTDPFRGEVPPAPAGGPVTLHGYTYDSVLIHSNSGGAYLFRNAAGEQVFVKESRAHNGYTGDGADAHSRLAAEYLTMRAVHARAPGLCPAPYDLFDHWEHRYLVSERVPGISLYRWMIVNNPALRSPSTATDFIEYHRQCLHLLDQLEDQLNRLHELGYAFLDVSSSNVLVDEQNRVRLIDFEAAQPIDRIRRIIGTPGYQHPNPRAALKEDPRELDRYGLSVLALMLLFPVHEVARRNPEALDHLHADLSEHAPVAPRLWERGTRYHDRTPESSLPTPDAVRADTVAALRRLAGQTADWLEAVAEPDHPRRVFPTIPLGYRTGTRAVAAGTAGVLHALHRAGRACDPAIVRRLRDDTLAAAGSSAPGLLFGTAGIACVLAELGEHDAADSLLTTAAEHPLNGTVATLGAGAAGTAVGLLDHYRRTGEQRWLDHAVRLLTALPDGEELRRQLGVERQSGLVGGRAGVALALYRLYRCTGDDALLHRGMRLLQAELEHSRPSWSGDGLIFKANPTDTRVYPYLFVGSASYATVLARYLQAGPDLQFGEDSPFPAAEALERCLAACRSSQFTALPGLYSGLAGVALTLADAGRRLGRPELLDRAFVLARGLFHHAVTQPIGVGWLGEPGVRLSAELWSGGAGILLALHQLTEPPSSAAGISAAPVLTELAGHS